MLFLYCHTLRSKSSQVHVLWEDHRNDIFINGFGILMSAGGSRLRWWLDPVGGLLIATGVIIAWVHTIYEQFGLLAGKSAPNEFIQLVIYKAMTFSADIDKIDTVRAYHSGPDYFVEVDIVMDALTPLWKAHDISQQLQDKLEDLPNVERAFVHVDHETTHAPEHRKTV
jgi:divalent metal cation (Fe/Co/Zn/Cd) transporter